jgi:hypothetical protein
MRAADARDAALTERLALAERELANAIEANRDLSEEMNELRSTLDALLATTGSVPSIPAAKEAPAPTKARAIF